jgi:hypothetical protein
MPRYRAVSDGPKCASENALMATGNWPGPWLVLCSSLVEEIIADDMGIPHGYEAYYKEREQARIATWMINDKANQAFTILERTYVSRKHLTSRFLFQRYKLDPFAIALED